MTAVLDSSTPARSPDASACCQRTALVLGSKPTTIGVAVPGCFLPNATARSPSSITFSASKPATLGATSGPLQPGRASPRFNQPRQSSPDEAYESGHHAGRGESVDVPASASTRTFFS